MGEPGSSAVEGAAASSSSGSGSSGAGASGSEPDFSTMTEDEVKAFIDTGRTGRRNAMPDVSEHGAITTTAAGMAEALDALSFQSGSGEGSGGSNEACSSSSSSSKSS